MRDLDEAELTRLQNQSVAVVAHATRRLSNALTPEAEAVVLAVPALCDEVRHLREALRHYAEGYPGGIGDTAREALEATG